MAKTSDERIIPSLVPEPTEEEMDIALGDPSLAEQFAHCRVRERRAGMLFSAELVGEFTYSSLGAGDPVQEYAGAVIKRTLAAHDAAVAAMKEKDHA